MIVADHGQFFIAGWAASGRRIRSRYSQSNGIADFPQGKGFSHGLVWEHLCQGSSRAVFSVLVGQYERSEGSALAGAMRATTSHEVSWCQASIALPNQKVAPAVSFGLGPALSFFSNSDQRLTDVGPVELWATH